MLGTILSTRELLETSWCVGYFVSCRTNTALPLAIISMLKLSLCCGASEPYTSTVLLESTGTGIPAVFRPVQS